MDVRSLERRPHYKDVMDKVSAMVPWFPKTKRTKKTKEEPLETEDPTISQTHQS